MKQFLLFALALTMGAATANAGQQISFNHSQNQKQVMTEAQLPVQVKNFLKSGNLTGKVEKDFYGNPLSPFRLINRQVITASAEEVERNPRARSAKLRIAEKV
jgi:16S rRNA C1402 N4-methylase RsmH